MKVLLTGATGFLGSNLTRRLLEAGHEIVVLKRSFSDLSRLGDFLPHLTFFDIDRAPLADLFKTISNIETVVHTATCYGRGKESCSEIFNTNTVFPLQLLELAASGGVATFVNTDTSLDRFLNPYALSKRQFAEWGRLLADKKGIRFVNLELEHFYGSGDDAGKFSTHVIRSCLSDLPTLPLTLGEQRRDFIHIEDVVAAYLVVLATVPGAHGYFQNLEIGSGESIPIRDFVEMVHRLTGSSTRLDFGALPYRENEAMDSRADISALSALGWRPQIRLEDGLATTIAAEKLKGRFL